MPKPDEELLALARDVEVCALSARKAALQGSPEDRKRERARMERMLRSWRNLREEEGAPYHDARDLLVNWIRFMAEAQRGEEPRPLEVRRKRAERAAGMVAKLYPSLALRLSEPGRLDAVQAAIDACARRKTGSVPWKLVAAAWEGIEAQPSSEAWRVGRAKRRRRKP